MALLCLCSDRIIARSTSSHSSATQRLSHFLSSLMSVLSKSRSVPNSHAGSGSYGSLSRATKRLRHMVKLLIGLIQGRGLSSKTD